MMTRTFTSLAVMGALGLLAPIHANAFGLGKLELSSALNEPFKAEISITALKGDEAANLQVRLASNKEFERAGIERNFMLTQLKFDVVKKSDGVKIVISSEQAIREPFIDFLLTATTTSSGRLIREYTVLLDPPVNVFKKSEKVVKQTTAAASTNNSYQYPTSSVSTTTNSVANSSSVNSYATNRNDTLWEVALKTRPDRKISVHQMMMALLKSNPEAFHRGNVNGLKAGYTLAVPSEAEIYQLNKQQAVNAFQEQNDMWKNRNHRPAAKTPVADTSSSAESATEVKNVSPSDETVEASVANNDSARLQLVVPTDKAALNDDTLSPLGGEKIKDLSEQLTLAQETIEGQTQENVDFKARMDAMEEQMETMRRLISLKDADLARLQSMLEKDQQLPEGGATTDVTNQIPAEGDSVVNPEVESSSEVSSVEKWEAVIDQSDESEGAEAIPAAADSSDDAAIDSDFTSANAEMGATEDEASDTTIDNYIATARTFITENKVGMTIVGTSVLLLLLVLLMLKRRKESNQEWNETAIPDNSYDEDSFTKTADSSDDVETDALQETDTVEEVSAVDSPKVETKTVSELLEQADSLIGFGDYQQAATLLEQAKKQEPVNQAVLMKSLFVMYKRKQADAFIAMASGFDKSTSEWAEISKWGRELAPSNPQFKDNKVELSPLSELNLEADSFVANVAPVVADKEVVQESALDLETDSFVANVAPTADTLSVQNNEITAEDNAAEVIDIDLNDSRADELVLPEVSLPTLDITDEKDDELLSFDTSFDLDKDDSSLELDTSLNDTPLSFDLDSDIEATALPLDDEPALQFEELSLPDVEPLSIEDSALDNLDDLNISLETEAAPVTDELEFDISGFDEIDEAETKLDLASAYADMGDPAGARSILEEVLKEGNDVQKSKAQSLLDDLS